MTELFDNIGEIKRLIQSGDPVARDSGYERLFDWDHSYRSPVVGGEPLIDVLLANLSAEYHEHPSNFTTALYALYAVTVQKPQNDHGWHVLIDYLHSTDSNEIKEMAILDILGNLGKNEFLPILKTYCTHPDASVADSAKFSYDDLAYQVDKDINGDDNRRILPILSRLYSRIQNHFYGSAINSKIEKRMWSSPFPIPSGRTASGRR